MWDKLQAFRAFFMKLLPLLMGLLVIAVTLFAPNAPGASLELTVYGVVLIGAGGLAFGGPRLGYLILGPIVAGGFLAMDNWDWWGNGFLTAILALGGYWLYAWTEHSRVIKK